MGESKRRKLSGAIQREIAPEKADKDELARREKVKAELRRLMDVVDSGAFGGMVVGEFVANADGDDDETPKLMTNLVGEMHVIQGMCVSVIRHYSEKESRQKGQAKPLFFPG